MYFIKKLLYSWLIIILFTQTTFAANPIWTTAFGFYNGLRFASPFGIALDADRKIYIVDYNNHRAFVLNNDYTDNMELIAGGGFFPTQGPLSMVEDMKLRQVEQL